MDVHKDINWELFTGEEKEQILKCIEAGDIGSITSLPALTPLTPEKEQEFQKVVDAYTEKPNVIESEVRKELAQFWAQGNNFSSPEEEAEWQKRIDEERKEQLAAGESNDEPEKVHEENPVESKETKKQD